MQLAKSKGARLRVLIVATNEEGSKLADLLEATLGRVSARHCLDRSTLERALEDGEVDVVIAAGAPGCSARDALDAIGARDVPLVIIHGDDPVEAPTLLRAGAQDWLSRAETADLIVPVVNRVLLELGERELRARRRQDERFVKMTRELLGVVSFDGILVRVNSAWVTTLGWSVAELLGRAQHDLLHEDDQDSARKRFRRLTRGACASVIERSRWRHKDGSVRHLEFVCEASEADRAVYIVGRDVSAEVAAKNELLWSETRMKRLWDSGIIGIVITDVFGNVFEANDAYCAMLGCTQHDLVRGSIRWSDLIAPESIDGVQRSIDELTRFGVSSPFETDLDLPDGGRRTFLVGAALLEYPRCIAFTTDVTERKRTEESLRRSEHLLRHAQKMESIGQLAAGIAHEINTPAQYVSDNITFLTRALTPAIEALDATAKVLGASAAGVGPDEVVKLRTTLRRAKSDFLSKHVPRALEQSLEGMRRVCNIVAAMKDFSHPSGQEPEDTDLRDLIAATVTVSTNEWKYVAEIETSVADDLPPVACYRDALGQVLLNLIVNAAHAVADATDRGERGRGRISIAAALDGADVEIRVTDSGRGVPAEVRERIFDPFFTTKPVGQGTGQGLAIAYSVIVDKHGGEIRLVQEEGAGACFVVRIPVLGRRSNVSRLRGSFAAGPREEGLAS